MLIGDLDRDRAKRDPAYLARVRRFLVWPDRLPAADVVAFPAHAGTPAEAEPPRRSRAGAPARRQATR